MEMKYNVTGAERKRLVKAISDYLDAPAKYMGMPTAAYVIGGCTVDKIGTLTFAESVSADDAELLVEHLLEQGFEPESQQAESYGLVISIPRDATPDAAIENLKRMLQAKGDLIRKATGADNVAMEVEETVLRFPWYDTIPDPEMTSAVSRLIGKMLATAKAKKRIVLKEETVLPENEKYAFRCYLLSLGFIGVEYKDTRKTLLRNLTGSGAFKSGAKKEV